MNLVNPKYEALSRGLFAFSDCYSFELNQKCVIAELKFVVNISFSENSYVSNYSEAYRYSFNGKEKENEIASGDLDFGARIYDARLGRWLSVDPVSWATSGLSPYAYVINCPIRLTDNSGLIATDPQGNIIVSTDGCPPPAWDAPLELKVTKNADGSTTTQTLQRKYQTVTIFCDDGTPVEAKQLLEQYVETVTTKADGTKVVTKEVVSNAQIGSESDCHGYTFVKGNLWINDNQVESIIKHDGYTITSEQKAIPGDIVVFRASCDLYEGADGNLTPTAPTPDAQPLYKGGDIMHSAVVESPGKFKGDAGIMHARTGMTLQEAGGDFYKYGQVTYYNQNSNVGLGFTGGTVNNGKRTYAASVMSKNEIINKIQQANVNPYGKEVPITPKLSAVPTGE